MYAEQRLEAGVERREVVDSVSRRLEGHRRGCLLEVEMEIVHGDGQGTD